VTGAQYRHPQVGYGTGYRYGYGYGHHGYRYGYRGYPAYGYPYYGGYYAPYYPYGYGWGLGLSFSYGGGYAAGYAAPYYAGGYAPAPSISYAPVYVGGEAVPRGYEGGEEAVEVQRDRRETGLLYLEITPEDAAVYIDDAYRGTARDLRGLRLRPGRHRVEIVRPGFRVAEREVEVVAGITVTLAVDLERP
jgi:hypothetical protein